MSTPVAVVAIIGAFAVGLLLGVPLAFALLKRRLKGRLSSEERVESVAPNPAPAVTAVTQAASSVEPTLKLPKPPKPHRAEYVITSAGEPEDEVEGTARTEFKPRPQLDQVARTVLIEAASIAHGVRNALSEENRAKISYEIKRELIRLRKDRKTEVKEALREYRAKHRAPVQPDSGDQE